MPANIPVLKRFIGRIFRIAKEESEEDTKQEILSEVSLKGATLWLLVFTMILTCVGLNMNSIYALIGAMLMSPLMAPVIGLGFAIATNDRPMV
ncbi:MAG TPA: TIGR00341 family protein, partial [Agriterribacter sp.]|nr:TIGR00341 family protein [Agriterribacter sp.]